MMQKKTTNKNGEDSKTENECEKELNAEQCLDA